MPRTGAQPRGPGLGWWWLWVIIILVIVFFVWVYAWKPGAGAHTAPAGPPRTATTENLDVFIGKQVELTAITVERVVNPHAFWVGKAGDEVLVIAEHGASAAVAAGQKINITGRVETLPSIRQAAQQWGLPAEDILKLQRRQIYLDATEVAIRQP